MFCTMMLALADALRKNTSKLTGKSSERDVSLPRYSSSPHS